MSVTWKERLEGKIRADWGREIDVFETQMQLKRQGKIDDKLFAETRLRRGVYGQRYDNGRRHDGVKEQKLEYPCGSLTKGPDTVWDAPGMLRIKIPLGRISADQLEVMAELAEEYSDEILHITTRQDVQLHFVHLDDMPDVMRRLAAVGITTREACGNSVRNVTACPWSGVCAGEAFDSTPYANALAFFLLGHDDVQDFGRKLKIAFSGCKDEPCGLTNFHDLGAIAVEREVGGQTVRGFEVYVGGGLGSVPQSAKLLSEFTTEQELFPLAQAVCRVFGRLGEKDNRSRARLKFLVKKLGIEEFRRLVLQERDKLRPDERWTAFLDELKDTDDRPLREPSESPSISSAAFEAWRQHNVKAQRQPGYCSITIKLPLGDFTSRQARRVADAMRQWTGDTLRATAEQNLVLRWVSNADLPAVHQLLSEAGLGEGGAETINDVTSCPGTDTCKLGISASRGLAGELRRRLQVVSSELSPEAQRLRVKCSGCFNSCGQHHVADIGFLGVSRNVGGRRVPHFQLVVGGQWTHNAASFGLAIGAIPSKNVPQALDRLTARFTSERLGEESFQAFIERIGKKAVRAMIQDLTAVPPYDVDKSFYSDWSDPREYTIDDLGVGECAGEVVPFVQMGLAAAEREIFEAQELLEQGQPAPAAARALSAMLQAARALAREHNPNMGEAPDEVVAEFRKHLVETRLFTDPYAGDKFAHLLFKGAERGSGVDTQDAAHESIEEAQLFVDAAFQCHARIGSGSL